MKKLISIFLLIFPMCSFSSVPLEISLEEMAKNSDHLLVGHVIGVDMVDGQGNEITDLNAMTGPGIDNLIRLVIEVDEVVISPARSVPKVLKVPLDPFMHYKFGQVKEMHSAPGQKFLLLLNGDSFKPYLPGVFGRDLSEKSKVIELMKSNKSFKPTALRAAA
jgi:hypothetical protein